MIAMLTMLGAALTLAACAAEGEAQQQSGRTMGGGMEMMGGSSGGMMSGGMMGDMRSIRGLLASHESIERRVEDIPTGVRTVTTSKDPEIAKLIRTHVRQMKARYESDQSIRRMDPVFRELFRNRDKALLEYQDIPGGIQVTHTSDDPQVVLLIRQHARHFVSEAAEQGMSRAMRPTPLPEGYRASTE